MKILAIIGSPRKGNSLKVVRQIENKMMSMGNVEFEYLFLKDCNLEQCRGCHLCLTKGENFCPIKDNRGEIEDKMHKADGVIFASPVYTMSITGLMKSFFDRFAYICHRPRFFDKYALIVSTTGAVGLREALNCLEWSVRTWGFNIVQKLGVNMQNLDDASKNKEKALMKISKSAEKFYNAVNEKKIYSPSLMSLISFNAQKASFAKANKEYADYKYFESKGWLNKNTEYYCSTKINFLKSTISRTFIKIVLGIQ